MFAVMSEPLAPYYFAAGIAVLILSLLVLARRYYVARNVSGNALLWLLVGICMVIPALFPSIARLPREYYDGKDQIEWSRLASTSSTDAATRLNAIESLCHILRNRPQQKFVRMSAFQGLVDAHAEEAIPFLLEMLDDQDEDMRERAKNALDTIDRTAQG